MSAVSHDLAERLARVGESEQVTVLTGAGISAESGIPTFRGPEGYWTVGSRVYQPQEIATHEMFSRRPRDVWRWYLYRRGVCRSASPNAGHLSLVALERHLGDRTVLLTQNVDGLHLRAGNQPARTWEIHGNIDFMRCDKACTAERFVIPDAIGPIERDGDLRSEQWARLTCPRCGGLARPHVLLWDEYYDETFYRFESSMMRAGETDLLIVVGTTGSTNLPVRVAGTVARMGATIVDVNPEDNAFGDLARVAGGFVVRAPASEALPEIVRRVIG